MLVYSYLKTMTAHELYGQAFKNSLVGDTIDVSGESYTILGFYPPKRGDNVLSLDLQELLCFDELAVAFDLPRLIVKKTSELSKDERKLEIRSLRERILALEQQIDSEEDNNA